MTKVVLETAAFADAIKSANIVAPTRGKAYDEAGGLVLEVQPDVGAIVIRSTNGEVWFREWVNAESIEGEATSWRVFAEVFAPLIGTLPIGSGKTVTLEEIKHGHGSQLLVSSGKVKSKLGMMPMTYYPSWDVFDPDGLTVISDLGARVKLVEWAAGVREAGSALSGIHFDGNTVRATDRYRLAVVPLPLGEHAHVPATVPAGILGRLLKQTSETRISFTEHQLLLMPNETTQIRMVIIAAGYPSTGRLEQREYPASITFPKEEVVTAINRAALAAPADRMPMLNMYIGQEELAFRVGTDTSTIIDTVDVPGQAQHSRLCINLTPKTFIDTLSNAPGESVTMHYNPANPEAFLYVTAANDYEVWVVARAAKKEASDAG